MEKFNYDAKTMSTQHIIDDLNGLIDEFNQFHESVNSYIESLAYQKNDSRLKMEIQSNLNAYYNEHDNLSVSIPDRLLVLKDEYISRMIITPEDINVKGVIVKFNQDLIAELVEIDNKLLSLENILHSS